MNAAVAALASPAARPVRCRAAARFQALGTPHQSIRLTPTSRAPHRVCLRRRRTWRLTPPAATAQDGLQQQQQPTAGLQQQPGGAVGRFLAAFNSSPRSLEGMLACLAPDVAYLNLALAPEPFRGQQAVRQVLASLVASAPPDWRLVVDDATPPPPSSSSAVAVVFHLEDGSGQAVPLSRGVAFYRLDQAGRIAHITEAAEQVVKMPQAVLPVAGAAAPLLQALRSSPLGSLVPGGLAAGMPMPLAASAPSQQPPQAFYAAAPAQPQASSSFGSPHAGLAAGGRPSAGSSSPSTRGSGMAAATPPTASSGSSSSSSSSGGGGSGDPSRIAGLAGVWIKDQAASDAASYSRACDLLQLSGLQKTTAMQLIEGVEIEQQGSEVAICFLTVVPFFKVTERVELGATSSMGRRDLRGGSQRATAAAQPDGSLRVDIAWEEPNAGSICEQWRLVDGGSSLECSSTVAVRAGSVTTRTLYRRSSDGWRPRFQWNPLYNLMGGSS